MPQLTIHNAQITTATVQIKTLTITGKQVTLAVFRQLREEPLIADDGTLNGIPWGTVNYHPDKCADRTEHWHVVWQRGSELLRSMASTEFRPERVLWSDRLADYYAAAVHHWLSTGEVKDWQGGVFMLFSGQLKDNNHGGLVSRGYQRKRWVEAQDEVTYTDSEARISVGLDVPKEVRAAVLAKSALVGLHEDLREAEEEAETALESLRVAEEDLGVAVATAPDLSADHSPHCFCRQCLRADEEKAQAQVGAAERKLKRAQETIQRVHPESPAVSEAKSEAAAALAVLGDRYATKPLDQMRAAWRDELAAEVARRQRHEDLRKAIADLPQLFIAV